MSDHVRIHITFDNPEEAGMAGESFHALRVGDGPGPDLGLYKIDNIPFFAELRLHDVVLCQENRVDDDGTRLLIPEIIEVVDRSPRRTVQIIFLPHVTNDDQLEVTKTLRETFDVALERATGAFWVGALPEDEEKALLGIQFLQWGHNDKVLDYFLGDA